MSLRFRIILLFVGLAILPMLIVAGFGYWQARGLLMGAAQQGLNQTVERVAEVLEVRGSRIDKALQELGSTPGIRELLPSTSMDSGFREILPPALRDAEYIEVGRTDGSSAILAGKVPSDFVRSEPSGNSALLVFSSDLLNPPEIGGVSKAAFWSGDLIPEEVLNLGRSILLLESATGRVLFSSGSAFPRVGDVVGSVSELAEAIPIDLQTPGTFRYRDAEGLRLGSVAPVQGEPWVLMASSSTGTALSSLNQLVGVYWAFVIGLAVFTGLAFSILIGRFTRSLRDLADAAEHIGRGELEPWLPLPTSGEVGQVTLAFNRMLDRIREMMGQVDRNGRLAVLGQLSAYFAHEIRNPLTSVKLNLQRMNRWAQRGRIPEFCLEPIEISLREVERLSASVSDVLQLSRSEDAPPESFSLHDLVEESTHLLQSRFSSQGVQVRLDLDAEADRILARPGQVKSVVLNLMINALEAQPEGGYLEVDSDLIRPRGFQGPVVAVRFRDGGPGVPSEIRDRVFEPFFTTKANGSGIGLAVARRAVADNHGHLFLEPSLISRSGAEFVMAFPLAPVEAGNLSGGTSDPWESRDRMGGDLRGSVRPGAPSGSGIQIPARLLTPEGIETVMALSSSDPEEIN